MSLIKTNNTAHTLISKLSKKDERKLLKTFLLYSLHQLFVELFKNKFTSESITECYNMDKKIIQALIYDIIETGEYTLEGIAYHTHIPYDVICAAAYGMYTQFSITLLAKLGELYIEVKPDIAQVLINKLIEIKEQCIAILNS